MAHKTTSTGISAPAHTMKEIKAEAKKNRRSVSAFIVDLFFFWKQNKPK